MLSLDIFGLELIYKGPLRLTFYTFSLLLMSVVFSRKISHCVRAIFFYDVKNHKV